jgi:hypothetical protein
MEIFRVPRRLVHVRLLLDDGRTVEGRLFTALSGPDGRPERLIDHLNDPTEEFIPFAIGEDRLLIGKAGIVYVQMAERPDEIEGVAGPGRGRRAAVRLTLTGGISLLGQFAIDMPPERSRVVDYLNAAPRFLPLAGEGQVTLVQRNHVVSARSED